MSRAVARSSEAFAIPFLIHEEIKFAHAAIESLYEPSVDRGRLVVVHGPTGCGKSHLAHLLIRELARSQSVATHVFTPPDLRDEPLESFPEIPWPVENNKRTPVGTARRLLICDDLQLAARHDSIQATIIRWFDDCLASGVDVLVTLNRTPGDVAGLNLRLRNRLRAGTCVGVTLPNRASREALIQHFCTHTQLALPMNVIRLLARELELSPRELLGTLRRFDDFTLQNVLLLDARAAMAFLKTEILPQKLDVESITRLVAREFGVKVADVRSTARDSTLKTARQCAMYLTRELTDLQFAKIGEYFENRSHSTVMHACEKIAEQLPDDATLRHIVSTVRQRLQQR